MAVFVDHLGLFAGLRLLLLAVHNPLVSIRYLSTSNGGRVTAVLLRKLGLCSSIEKIDLDFSALMPEGGGLWYWLQAAVEDVAKVMAVKLAEDGTFLKHISAKIELVRRIAFVRKLVSLELYQTMTLVFLAQKEIRPGNRSVRMVILVSMSDLLPLFIEASGQWARDIIFVKFFHWRNSGLVRIIWFLSKQGQILGWSVVDHFRRQAKENYRMANTVAMQFIWGLNSSQRQNDLWWYEPSGIERSRCLMFFDHRTAPATDQIIQSFEDLGLRYRILSDRCNKTGRVRTDRFSHQRVRMVIPDLILLSKFLLWMRPAKAPRWQIAKFLVALVRIRQWETFMTAENVKVIFDVAETSLDTASLAADMVGAVKIGMHWSDCPVPSARVTPLHQVQFIWGPRYQPILESMGAASNVLVQAGNIFDAGEARPQRQERAKVYRTNLERVGVKHIVGVLDRSCSPTSLCPPAYHIEFYEALFSWLENDIEIGMIIKPKTSADLSANAYKPELSKRLERLILAGRVVLLDNKQSPEEAAYSSDIVVALGLNSAGVLCALKGERVVFWDPAQAKESPLGHWVRRFGWDKENLVLNSMSQLIDAVKHYFKCPSDISELGDLSSVLDEIDRFRDGKTGMRVGAFVRWFLEGSDQGLGRTGALQLATKNYAAQWGADKVSICFGDPAISEILSHQSGDP